MSENIHKARETRDAIAFVPQRDADNELWIEKDLEGSGQGD